MEWPDPRARGNLLLRLDGATIPNPTQTLIAALQRRDKENGKTVRDNLSKDEEFYLGILTPGVGGAKRADSSRSRAWSGSRAATRRAAR